MNKNFYLYVFAITIFLSITNLAIANPLANTTCFIAQENGEIIKQAGNCSTRHSPCSTFKIAISLMGYNEGILINATKPEFPYKPEYTAVNREVCQQPQNPASWIKNSCIWYSQVITSKIGMAKFKDYLAKFNYGNQDAAGEKNENNGLTISWLSSSLQISPKEQLNFLAKLLVTKLPVSKQAQDYTRKIFLVGPLKNGWNLYGKTGTGYLRDSKGAVNRNSELGWFVGWIEKGARQIIFAQYIENTEQHSRDISAGTQAKEISLEGLEWFMQKKHPC